MSSKAIAERKEACGYTPATLRTDHCGGCARMEHEVRNPDRFDERQVMVCKLHQIPVTRGSICEDWGKKS
jgi:hypothetical protein